MPEVAQSVLAETGIQSCVCPDVASLIVSLQEGAGFAIITEEAIRTADLRVLRKWIVEQPEWSDFPFVLLTLRGGGLERNPSAGRYLGILGNVTFLERPFSYRQRLSALPRPHFVDADGNPTPAVGFLHFRQARRVIARLSRELRISRSYRLTRAAS